MFRNTLKVTFDVDKLDSLDLDTLILEELLLLVVTGFVNRRDLHPLCKCLDKTLCTVLVGTGVGPMFDVKVGTDLLVEHVTVPAASPGVLLTS